MYKIQHLGKYPEFANFSDQMTKATNISGGATGDTPYGPYVSGDIPANPFNGSNAIVAVATAGATPSAVVAGDAGWQYDESTGAVWPNNAEAYP